MRLYIRRGSLIAESQERVARAKPLTGDMGVSPTIKFPLLLARRRGPGGSGRPARDIDADRFESPLDRRLGSRMAI